MKYPTPLAIQGKRCIAAPCRLGSLRFSQSCSLLKRSSYLLACAGETPLIFALHIKPFPLYRRAFESSALHCRTYSLLRIKMETKSGFELQQHAVHAPAQYRADYTYDNEHNVNHDIHDGIRTGNSADAFDMRRMGRKQELRRNFKSISILGLAAVTMATWLALLVGSLFSLTNGGLAGTIWVYLGSWICTMTLVSSLAEMASMAPTSGGQYHWVSEFAPASQQAFLSYVVGWLAALGWQAIIAGGSFSTAALLLQLVSFNNPSYDPENWHVTLLMIGVAVFAAVFNTAGARQLPMIEGVILFVGRPKTKAAGQSLTAKTGPCFRFLCDHHYAVGNGAQGTRK